MRSSCAFWILTFTAIGLLGQASRVQAEAITIVRGRVVNGTFHQRAVSKQTVELLRMREGEARTIASVETDNNGDFLFRIDAGDGTFLVFTRYRGVAYTSRPIRAPADFSKSIDVVVYERTFDRPAISFPFRIVLVERLGVGAIQVREIIGVENPARRTYMGQEVNTERRVSFAIGVPPQAAGVTLLRGMASPSFEQGRLLETAPLLPGVQEVALTYQVRYRGASTILQWMLEENTGSMDVFIPDQGVRVTSATLTALPPRVVRGTQLLRFGENDLAKGSVVTVTLAGLPADYGYLVRWFTGALAVLLAMSLAVSVRVARKRAPKPTG